MAARRRRSSRPGRASWIGRSDDALVAGLRRPGAAGIGAGTGRQYLQLDRLHRPAVLADFTKETGIKTRYDVFDSLETLEAKLLAGHSGYDIVAPSNEPSFSRLIRAGALATIDRAKVPNWKNLDPALMQRIEASDPGNRHGAIYLWGSIGLGINPDRIRALAPDAPLDSWALLLDPAWAKLLAPCGIIMMDSAIDVIPSVLRYLGRSPDSSTPEDLTAVLKALMAIRPYIRDFASGGALEALATGQACLALDYSGDVAQASARAKRRESTCAMWHRRKAPKSASTCWRSRPMRRIRPRRWRSSTSCCGRISWRGSPIRHIIRTRCRRRGCWCRPELLNDPNVFPTDALMQRFFTIGPSTQAADRGRTRLWARFKAGN